MRTVPLFATAIALAALASTGCPGSGLPGESSVPGRDKRAGTVDPNTCGSYASTDLGAKLKGFLEATVQLNDVVLETEAEVKATCAGMAAELGIADTGDTAAVCNAVVEEIQNNLSVGLKAGASLTVDYKPAECTVNVDAAASAAAQCEAQASGDVSVTCEGTCQGTCQGTCDGACEGSAGTGGSGGQCNGQCQGTCQGECSGGCDGHADVQASAECEAQAEVRANVDAECTEPEVTIEYDAAIVVDGPKIEKTVAALKKGLPKMLVVSARIGGPVQASFRTWSATATDLAGASVTKFRTLGDQAGCVARQLAAAAGMIGNIEASIQVQVEVSASVSASAGGSGSASAGG